jgi:predicted dehydrogenase
MKIAIIGIGKMGKFHARTALNHSEFSFTGVYDIDKEVSKLFVEEQLKLGHKLKVFKSIKELVAYNDAVIISTPAKTHFDVLKEVNSHKDIHILCEKPLTDTLNRFADVYVMKAKRKGLINVGFCERHGDLIPFMTNITNIEEIKFVRHNTGNRNSDINIIYDTMIHDIDLLFFIFPAIAIEGITIKKKEYDTDGKTLKHVVCEISKKLKTKIIFDCGKGMKSVKRYAQLTLKDKTVLKYDFINSSIEYGLKNNPIIIGSNFVNQKGADKLTSQLDEFYTEITSPSKSLINASVYDIAKCMSVTDAICEILNK